MTDLWSDQRMRIFEFIAAPAHGWIWICAKLCGGTFHFGPVEDVEEEEDEDNL